MTRIGRSLEEAVAQHDKVSEVQSSFTEVKKRAEELQSEVSGSSWLPWLPWLPWVLTGTVVYLKMFWK